MLVLCLCWLLRNAISALQDLLYRRGRALVDYENANKALDKARAKNKDVLQAETTQQVCCQKFEKISESAKQGICCCFCHFLSCRTVSHCDCVCMFTCKWHCIYLKLYCYCAKCVFWLTNFLFSLPHRTGRFQNKKSSSLQKELGRTCWAWTQTC